MIIEDSVKSETKGRAKESEYLQALLEFMKYTDKTKTKSEKELSAHIDKETSNRYSYYYGRMEAALYAPILALIVFAGTVAFAGLETHLSSIGVGVAIGIGSISSILFLYAIKLLKEIDAIETLLVTHRKEQLLELIPLLKTANMIVYDPPESRLSRIKRLLGTIEKKYFG
jgi:hypothetical protein